MTHRSFMARLKSETQQLHSSLDDQPFYQAIKEQNLPLRSYVCFLRAMAVAHAVFEYELSLSNNPILKQVWNNKMCRLNRLEQDLSYFDKEPIADIVEANEHALNFAGKIRLWCSPKSLELLGCIYVFLGSSLGAEILRPQIARLYKLDDQGLSYLSWLDRDTKDLWLEFKRKMNALDIPEQQRKTIVTSARETFQGVIKIVTSVYPITESDTVYLASTINPEAGVHPVTNDPLELLAAIEAGETTWQTFPYLEERYGDRGKRFTRSDSAWLVTLANQSQEDVNEEIEWLGRVLASRGMPQHILETHLENLYDSLVRIIPARKSHYEKLKNAAKMLHDKRRQHIIDPDFKSLVQEFRTRVEIRQIGVRHETKMIGGVGCCGRELCC